jgi:hypothetical protein
MDQLASQKEEAKNYQAEIINWKQKTQVPRELTQAAQMQSMDMPHKMGV